MKALHIIGILVVLIIIVGGAILLSKPASAEPIKVGSILPLTGEAAEIGLRAQEAISLAAEEINSKGGINGKKLQVIFEDGKCDARAGLDAATKLVNFDRVQAIIGGLCSGETLGVAPVAEQNKVALLSPCSSAPKISEAGDFIFRVYPSDTFQGSFGAEYVYNKLGIRKVAVLHTIGDWGNGIKDVFKQRFIELGGQIVAEESFEQSATDMRSQLTKIKAANPELIYMPAYSQGAGLILKQAKELGISAKMLDGDGGDDPNVIKVAGDAAEGFQATVAASGSDTFAKKFSAKFGHEPLVCTTYSYDAVNILGGILKTSTSGEAIKNELYKVKDYKGETGSITLDSNGDRTTAEYVIKEVRNGELVIIKNSDARTTIKIGATLPLTGDTAFLGESMRDAILIAKEKLSGKKYNYEIVFEDDKLNPQQTAIAANKLIFADKVNAILSISSGTGNVVTPIAEENRVIHFGIASDANVANGKYNFIHWTPPEEEARIWAEEAQKRGIKRVSIIKVNQQGSFAIADSLKKEIASRGIEVVSDQTFNFGDRDFRTIILKAKDANPDILFLMALSPEVELIEKQRKELGVNISISGIESFELSSEPATFEGFWYVNAAEPQNFFLNEFQIKYNRIPQLGSPNAYDAVLMIAEAAEKAGDGTSIPSSEKIADELMKIRSFSGALGELNMGNDSIVRSKAVVKIIREGRPITIG